VGMLSFWRMIKSVRFAWMNVKKLLPWRTIT